MALTNLVTSLVLDVYDHDTTPASVKAIALDKQTRYIKATLTYRGADYPVDENATVTLTVIRPDKTGVQVTGSVVDVDNADRTGTIKGVYAELSQTALAVKGNLKAQFMVAVGDQILRTEIFSVKNGEALDADVSEWAGEYQGYNLDELVQSVNSAVATVGEMESDVSDLKEGLSYIYPIVAPIKTLVTSLTNGTISNPNNAFAVTLTNAVKCKKDDIVTLYPVRPNASGCQYQYAYRVYDANGNTVANVSDALPENNNIRIAWSNAASIKFSIFEYTGSSYNSLRASTYGYTPYVIVADGSSLLEKVSEKENLYKTYNYPIGNYSFTFSDPSVGSLTYGSAAFAAIIPCTPNTTYSIKLAEKITNTVRFRVAWAKDYPKASVAIYDISVHDNDLNVIYKTGDRAEYLIAYFGSITNVQNPEEQITINVVYDGIDSFARNYIYTSRDTLKQEANVLKLKKTGDETYSECDAKFMFMTDIHADVSRLKDATRRCKEWGNSYISAVLNGGDTVYQKLSDGLDWYYDQIDTIDIPVLPTVGNHDAWSALSVLETDPVVVYNAIIAPIASSTGIVQPANAATNGYNYYYKDFNNTVRLIVVDCMYWNATQLSWLENVLADAKTNSLHVLIMTHSSFPWADMETVDCSWSKAGMLNGYSSRGAISDPTRTNIQAAQAVKDFTDAGGTFICWLTGHQHGDDVHVLPNYGNQHVITLGSFAQRASMLQKSDIVTDYNYNCLTYITIDTFSKVIKFMRVGADIDMYGVKHNFLSIKYDETKIISAD